jgi:hypothetical protein
MRIGEVKPALGSGRNPGTGQHGLPIIGKFSGAGLEMTTREQHEDNATFINEYLAAKRQ